MRRNIQLKAIFNQQLKVIDHDETIGCMVDDQELIEFSRRLNEVCDDMAIPPKGKARQTGLAKIFSITQNATRKWLEAEGYCSIAMGKRIAAWAGVSFDWLMTGFGDKYPGGKPKTSEPDQQFIEAVQDGISVHELPEHIKQTILTLIASSPEKK